MSTSGSGDCDNIATFVVTALPPPIPSIFNGWPDPSAAISTSLKSSRLAGRSLRWKNGPREEPPRIKRNGIDVCISRPDLLRVHRTIICVGTQEP